MTPELTTVNTVIIVLLTLLVTYLSDSIRTSVSKRDAVIAAYKLLLNLLLIESKNLRFLSENSNENAPIILPQSMPYNLSVFESFQICQVDPHTSFYLLDACERYNLLRNNSVELNSDHLETMREALISDYKLLEKELIEVNKRTWFYYWLIDIKGLFLSPPATILEKSPLDK